MLLDHASCRKPASSILERKWCCPTMNMAGILSDSEGGSPAICLDTGFLDRIPSIHSSFTSKIMIAVGFAAPASRKDSTLATSQRGIAVVIGENRLIYFTPDISSTAIRLRNSCKEFRRNVSPLLFINSPKEGDCCVWSIVNFVAIIGVWMNNVDIGITLDV